MDILQDNTLHHSKDILLKCTLHMKGIPHKGTLQLAIPGHLLLTIQVLLALYKDLTQLAHYLGAFSGGKDYILLNSLVLFHSYLRDSEILT